MGQTVSGVYKTISYKHIEGGELLIAILPRAGARFATHSDLIQKLNKFGSVLFVESGYFGISKADHNLKEITIDKFYLTLHELITNLGFKKTELIGESVGAIHALNYASHYDKDVRLLLLSSPALYKPRWLYQLLVVPVLNLIINSSPEKLLNDFGRLLNKVPINKMQGLGNTLIGVDHSAGALSYLYCLEEIVDFNHRREDESIKRLLNKTYVLIGKKDKIFDLLCDKSYCENSLKYVEVPSAGHGLIDSNPEEVIRLLGKSSIFS